MVHINGELISQEQASISFDNRGTYYGDAVFETMRAHNGSILFFEAHYFRLMSGMRILRMDIPSLFTPEYIENAVMELLEKKELHNTAARIRFTVWRNTGGYYTPSDNGVQYSITCSALEQTSFKNVDERVVDLYKDYYVPSNLLSTIKSAQKMVHVLAGRFGHENGYHDMLLMNDQKMVVESIAGNLFLRKGNVVKTPPVIDGCLNGIMREQVIQQIKRMLNYEIVEETITPFELQRADELFTTNMIKGIQSITKYRKKNFENSLATELLELFNDKLFN